jgi:hypothetical protein
MTMIAPEAPTPFNRKPTFLQLWLSYTERLDDICEVADLPPLAIAAVVSGCEVPLDVFEATLAAFNTLADTHYTRDDLRNVRILPHDGSYVCQVSRSNEDGASIC